MLQAGRIVNVHLPKDRVTQTHQGYGFVEFISEEDAEYAARIMNQVRLYGKPIRVNKVCAPPLPLLKTHGRGADVPIGVGGQAEDGRGWSRAIRWKSGQYGGREDPLRYFQLVRKLDF